jgi:hypothetical protein
MANESEFPEQEAYPWPLVERAVRLLAMGLIVLGAGAIPIGIWADNVVVTTVGIDGVIASVAWWLWLSIPDP